MTPPESPSSDRAGLILFSIVVGFLINLLVTGACMVFHYVSNRPVPTHRTAAHAEVFSTTHHAMLGKAVVRWTADLAPGGPADVPPVEPPSWARLSEKQAREITAAPPAGASTPASYTAVACGLPWLSFKGGVTRIPWETPSLRSDAGPVMGEIRGAGRRTRRQGAPEPRILTYVPLWSGLLLNTAFYGVLTYASMRFEDRRRTNTVAPRDNASATNPAA